MTGDCTARHFDRHDWGGTLKKRNHQNPHDVKECVFFFCGLAHVGCDRTDQSIAEQNAKERSHQRGSDFVSDFFRRTAECTHSNDNTEHGRNNPEAGQGVGHRAEGGGGLGGIMVMNFHVEIKHLVEIESIEPGNGHAERVTNEIANVMILEEGGVLGEHLALVRLFDVGFEGHQAVFASLVEEVVHHLEGIDVGLFAELGTAKHASDAADYFLDDVEGVGDKNCPQGSTADDDQLRRLDEDSEISMLHQVAGDHTTEDDDDSDD